MHTTILFCVKSFQNKLFFREQIGDIFVRNGDRFSRFLFVCLFFFGTITNPRKLTNNDWRQNRRIR